MHRCRQCEKWMESRLRVYDRFGVFVTVHSYLVPATIYAHKINCIDFSACKLVIFMHNLHENTSRHTTCVQ